MAGVPVTVVMYEYTTNQKNNDDGLKKNISTADIRYYTIVSQMYSISKEEANQMLNGNGQNILSIKKTIENYMLENFQAVINVDYSIVGLQDIKTGVSIKNIDIFVISNSNSKKITGNREITIIAKEDISTWVLENKISVPSYEKDFLSETTAKLIINKIEREVDYQIDESQYNKIGVDYEITNLNLIKKGSKYTDFNNSIFVKSLPGSKNLVGDFQIQFEIQN